MENTREPKGCLFHGTAVFHLPTRVGELHLGVSSAVSQGSPTVPCSPGDEAHPNSLNRSRPTEGAAARF